MCVYKTISESFTKECIHLFSSWCWIRKDFLPEYEKLLEEGIIGGENPQGELIWETKQKYVYKITTFSSRNIVYKAYHCFRHPRHYLFRAAPTGLEALNYEKVIAMDIPTARVLAAGETRRFFFPRKAFFITGFLEKTSDGREFLKEGKEEKNTLWKNEFLAKNMQYIAIFHDHGFLHKGFTPYNTLWREKSSGEEKKEGDLLQVYWIDVASCREMKPNKKFLSGRAEDLAQFFSYFSLTEEERKNIWEIYCANTKTLQTGKKDFWNMVEDLYHKKIAK